MPQLEGTTYVRAWRRPESKIVKVIEAEIRMTVARGWREGKWGDGGQGVQSFSYER